MNYFDISGASKVSRLLCRQDSTAYLYSSSGSPLWGNPSYFWIRDGSRRGQSLVRQSWEDRGIGNVGTQLVPFYSVSDLTMRRETHIVEESPGQWRIKRYYTFSSPGRTTQNQTATTFASDPSVNTSYFYPGSGTGTYTDELCSPSRSDSDVTECWFLKPGKYELDESWDYNNTPAFSSPGVSTQGKHRVFVSCYGVIREINRRFRAFELTQSAYSSGSGAPGSSIRQLGTILNYPHLQFYMSMPFLIRYSPATIVGLICWDEWRIYRVWP